jgi:hypothetical protein
MKPHYHLFPLTLFTFATVCKSQTRIELTDEMISQRTSDSIAKNAFGKMVAGAEEVTSLANYLSFVPTDGKFTLSGNYFFHVNNKDTTKKRKAEYFAVGFNGSGSIVGGTVATLFETGKLNTGVDLGLKLSWRMNKPNFGSLASSSTTMIEKRSALQFERQQKIDSTKNALTLTLLKLQQAKLAIAEATINQSTAISDTVRFVSEIQKCATDTCRLRFIDSLFTAKSKIFKEDQRIKTLARDTIRLQEIYDVSQIKAGTKYEDRTARQRQLTNKYGLNRIDLTYEDTIINKIWNEYEDKIYEVEIARPIAGMRLNWISGIFNWNRVAYRNYFSKLPFTEALTKVDTSGYTLGLQANFYTFYKPVRKAKLFTIALLFKKTNDLEDLTSSKLTDEVTISDGTTTRKSNKEYTVYTDTVKLYNTVQLPINYYRFFGKDLQFGWHLFALADWRDTKKDIYDVGAGFIFGINTAGAKRLFNIEVFAKYRDLKQELVDEDKTGWKQLQAGLSIAVPFMIYKN